MKKLKKILPLVLIAALVLCLCSCGISEEKETTAQTAKETSTKQETTKESATQVQTTKEITTAAEITIKETTTVAETTTKEETTTAAIVQPEYLSGILARDGYDINNMGTDQLVLVAGDGTDATIYYYQCDDKGQWNLVRGDIAGFVGSQGVSADANEDASYSPKGLWNLGLAFGTKGNPGTALEFRDTTENSRWVDDRNSQYYNRWVEEGSVEQDWSSAENLNIWQYAYAVNIEYNYDNPVPGKGSAIFFHISDSPTAGCIGTSESELVSIMQWLKPGAKMLITTK